MSGTALLVNGEPITDEEIRAETAVLRQAVEQRGVELGFEQRMALRERAAATLVDRRLIYQEARRLKLAPTPEEINALGDTLVPRSDGVAGCRAGTDMQEVRREAERRLTYERMIAHWSRNIAPPKSTEVRDYYRSHAEQFRRPETIRVAHIARHIEGREPAEVRAEVEKARERLLAGEDWATITAECSDCPENSGDLGFIARGIMVEEFDKVVFEAPVNELTPVFETQFGFHVAIVRERRTAGIADLTEAGGHIADGLYRLKQDREVGRQLEILRRKARVEPGRQ